MKMELRLLRYFLTVAREGNITRASESLHIAQPSLSKQLMELEAELGKQLFIRSKRGVTLTDEGVLLRKRAEEILMLCEKTSQEISQSEDMITGEISIAGAPSAIVSQAVSAMMNAYPHVRFKFQNGDAARIEEELQHGLLDFGILLEPVDITKYEHITLAENVELGFLMRSDCPLAKKEFFTARDIENMPLILPRREGLQRELSSWAGCDTNTMNIVATFDLFFNIPVMLVEQGDGCAFVLNTAVNTSESSSLCFRPLKPAIRCEYGLAWKRYPAFPKAQEKFISILSEMLVNGSDEGQFH